MFKREDFNVNAHFQDSLYHVSL